MSLINCKAELKLKWTKFCLLAMVGANNVDDANSNIVIFTIKHTKFYVSLVTLSAKNNQNLLKLLSQKFEKPVCWNKYKTK